MATAALKKLLSPVNMKSQDFSLSNGKKCTIEMEQVYVNSVDCLLHLEGTSTYD